MNETGEQGAARPGADPDAGKASERTALAWRRTAISSMVVAVLFLNHAAVDDWRATGTAPLAAAGAMLALAALCLARNHSLHAGRRDGERGAIVMTTVAVVLVAAIAAGLGFVDPAP
ncbi:DUF202 domain-containing protein [Nocardia sp. NPDC005366]|uniref:DUF202 domain-containing protein n=1 Tax=Nocardia sp. NPDC005366 TaxID=3156878 RepID=UPI0033B8A116